MIYAYARVSTYGQSQSLEEQMADLKAAGYDRIFHEKISGATAERPQLKRMLKLIKPGDIVITTYLDRLGRDATDILVIVRQIEQAGGGYKSLTEPYCDTTSPFKDVFIHLTAMFAAMGRKRIIENTTAGRIRAKQRGQHMGRPFTMTPQQQQEARRRRSEGATLRELAESYDVSKATISRLCPAKIPVES
jgi:DNA invertase Pin-like site-specific DNA recombinase